MMNTFLRAARRGRSAASSTLRTWGRHRRSRTGFYQPQFTRGFSTSLILQAGGKGLDISEGLDEDQIAFQAMALDFAANEMEPYAEKWDKEHIFPADTLRSMAELGFGGIFVSEDMGGVGLRRQDGATIFEALATGCVSTSAFLTIHNMVAWMVDSFGNTDQRERFLPDLVTMKNFGAYCLTEPGAGSDAASLQTRAVKSDCGTYYTLNGSKAFISGGGDGACDLYVVMARTGTAEERHRGITAFVVPKDSEGLSFGPPEDKLGWNSQPTGAVNLDGVKVPVENRLGNEGDGFTFAMKALDGGRINIATTALGGALSAFFQARDYVNVREQFGTKLGNFQNTQFKIADMATELSAARLLVQRAAQLLDEKSPLATQRCAMAKRFGTDTAFNVANQALQMHGGYGYLKDYPIERIVRDLRVHQILEGTNEIMRVIVGRQVLSE